MKTWPTQIEVVFRSRGEPCARLLVLVALLAPRKNDFGLRPVQTENDGRIVLQSDELSDQIGELHREAPMDYGCGLEDCVGLTVLVERASELRRRIAELSEFYPADAARLHSLARASSNAQFAHYTRDVFRPFAEGPITIELERIRLSDDGRDGP